MITAEQYLAILAELGITQVGLAKLIGVSDGTTRRWSRKGVDGPPAILIRLMHERTLSIRRIEEAHPERRPGPVRVSEALEHRYRQAMTGRGLTPKPKKQRSK